MVKNEGKGVSVNIWVKVRGKEGPTKKRLGGTPCPLIHPHTTLHHQWNVTIGTLTENQVSTDTSKLRCSVSEMVLTSSPHYKQSLSPFFKSEMKVGYMGAMEVFYSCRNYM